MKGPALLHDPLINKGTAFTEQERDVLDLRGLLPPHVHTIAEQAERVMKNFKLKPDDLERYVQLISLQDRNETLFYHVVVKHLDEMMPIIYTPTVGKACQQYGQLFRRPRGLHVGASDRGHINEVLRNWPHRDVRVIVVTDGERILGLGDLGTFGMGIPIGKLSLYTACAGIQPARCLPIQIDVGTDNEALLQDPLYTGMRSRRLRGDEFNTLLEEFIVAAQHVFPKALIQFEDFGNANAFHLLATYRDRVCCFNDDIQGTAAVTLAGLFSSCKLTGGTIADHKVLFLGAGEAGIGIGDLIVTAMVEAGLDEAEARRRCWFVDSKGLIVKGRDHLTKHKQRFAHAAPYQATFQAALEAVRPTTIIGVSTIPKSFDQKVVETMAAINQRPVIFALSNPTTKAECSAEEAYTWSKGKAVFASGSPFPAFVHEGHRLVPGQGNNAYIFPGVGLGVIASEARSVTDRMFAVAARTLAEQVDERDLAKGRVYPSLKRIREVSARIAEAVAKVAFDDKLARAPRPRNLAASVRSLVWQPQYETYV